MKPNRTFIFRACVLALTILTVTSSRAQSGYAVAQRGADWNLHQKTVVENGVTNVHQYVELATGLNYTNTYGQLTPAVPQIVIQPGGGAAATQGQHKVYFPPDIYNGVLAVVTPDGRQLQSRPLGVCYDDGSNTVFIATLTNAIGYLTASNQVTYRDAFAGFKADLVCTYRKGGFECDLVFRQQPPTPADYGLDSSFTMLELVTEFFNTADPQEIPAGSDDWFGLQDSTLKFGKLTMTRGKAFAFSGTNATAQNATPVYKSWIHSGGRTFLIESVPLLNIADNLDALPLQSSIGRPGSKIKYASNQPFFPPSHDPVPGTNQILLASADFQHEPGVVLDYTTIDSDTNDFTFQSGQTYYISGSVNLSGTTTIQDGAVLKFDDNGCLWPDRDNLIACPPDASNPAILTSVDDNSVGEPIGSGSPAINTATYFSFSDNPSLSQCAISNLDVYYAGCAFQDDFEDGYVSWHIQDSKFFNCQTALYTWSPEVVLENDLFGDCQEVLYTENHCDLQAVQVTADSGGALIWDGGASGANVELTNSILSAVTNMIALSAGGEYLFDLFPSAYKAVTTLQNALIAGTNLNANIVYSQNSYQIYNPAGLYQTAANANYYLAPGSPYRNAGTTNIDPGLLAEIQTMTTCAPQDGGWPDTNGTDLGYHYPTNEDSDHDGIPDWWIWQYFQSYAYNGTNLDASGNTFLYDYQNGLDPNVIQFSIAITNDYVNNASAVLPLNLMGGVPFYVAVLVNDNNRADAVWMPYNSSNIVASLNQGDGGYYIQVGLGGHFTNSSPTWRSIYLVLNTIPPALVVTSPTTINVSNSPVALLGYADKGLASLTFDVSNVIGVLTNQTGILTGFYYDDNLSAYTTNYFTCPGIVLGDGSNLITLHATDLAGNASELSVLLDYTNQLVLNLVWPSNGLPVAGTSFTLQAQVSDPTAGVSATIVDAEGDTNTVQGLVESGGTAWVQNLPLANGTNTVTVTAGNASGTTNVQTFTVVGNDIGLTVDPLSQLNQSSVTVTGTIGDPVDDCVFVNGVRAYYVDGNAWEADKVPVNQSGTATLDIQVYTGDPVLIGEQMEAIAQPVTVQVKSFHIQRKSDGTTIVYGFHSNHVLDNTIIDWVEGVGGQYQETGYSDDIPGPINNQTTFGPNESNVSSFTEPWLYENSPEPWEYADVSGNINEPSTSGTWSLNSKFDIVIAPSGQEPAGSTNTYLVLASAAEYADPEYQSNPVPLPPEWLQIGGQTLVNSGITNGDGTVSGATTVSAPAGENVEVTPTATQFYANDDYTFNVQAMDITHLLAVDNNRDGNITFDAQDQTTPANPYRFWINDSQEGGDVSSAQYYVPGSSPPNYQNNQVNGRADLINYFPVALNIGNALASLPTTNGYEYHLSQADRAVKIVYTSLTPTNAFDYLTNTASTGYGTNANEAATNADTVQVWPSGATGTKLDTNWLAAVQGNGGQAVLLAEGCNATTNPLMLEIWAGGQKLGGVPLYLSISGVEQMYRWVNLRGAIGAPQTKATDTNEPANNPDALNQHGNLIFVHGYSVNENQAEGWNAEIFKRLYQSGSKAKFYAVDWYGSESQIIVNGHDFTPNYQTNVVNAFLTAPYLATLINGLSGPTVLAGHSLGNMVCLSAISDSGATPSQYFMIDAAVPMEAIDGTTPINNDMVTTNVGGGNWLAYSNRLWASEWHNLWPSTDARSTLTWSNRLGNLGSVDIYNFYSSGEDVLRDYPGTPPSSIITLGFDELAAWLQGQLGMYAWAWQEKDKGQMPSLLNNSILSSDHGGWLFNDAALNQSSYTTNSIASADAIPASQLQTNAFFDFGWGLTSNYPDYNSLQVANSSGSTYAAANRNRILSDAIPALTLPIGANSVSRLSPPKNLTENNADMETSLENGFPDGRPVITIGSNQFWEWRHSDLANVAYPFTYKIFNAIVNNANLK